MVYGVGVGVVVVRGGVEVDGPLGTAVAAIGQVC